MGILEFGFMRSALLVGLLVSVACGVIGTYVVVKKIVFISGGISHAAYGGIGLGYYLGFNPMAGATLFTVASALGMGLIRRRSSQRDDALIGVMWAVGMALGVIFIKLSPGYAADLMSYLFGSILTVPARDVLYIFILDLIIIGVVWRYFDEFKAVIFDEEFARVSGLKTDFLNILLLVLVALTVVVMIRAVGVILVIALLSIPPAIAGEFSHGLKGMMILAVLLGIVFTSAGLGLSYLFDLPSGATIILVAAAGYVLALFCKK